MAASTGERTVAELRAEWRGVIPALGIENLSPAEERERIDRLEQAVGSVFLFCAQLEIAEELGHGDQWAAANDCRIEWNGEGEE